MRSFLRWCDNHALIIVSGKEIARLTAAVSAAVYFCARLV